MNKKDALTPQKIMLVKIPQFFEKVLKFTIIYP